MSEQLNELMHRNLLISSDYVSLSDIQTPVSSVFNHVIFYIPAEMFNA